MLHNMMIIFTLLALAGSPTVLMKADELSVKPRPAPFTLDQVTAYTLPNGLKVLLYPDPSQAELTVNTVYKTGAKHEHPGEYGMAHLLEHLIFKSTRNHPNIPQELERRGARFNANTNADRTSYYMSLPVTADTLDFALALEAERMTGAILTDTALQAELPLVKKEYEQSHGTGFQPLLKAMLQITYPHHAYGRDTLGINEGVLQTRIENLRAFYQRRYGPNRAVLSLGGRFALDDAKRLIEKYFASVSSLAKDPDVEPPPPQPQRSERQIIVPRPGGPAYVGVLYRAMPGADSRFVAAQALVHCLAGGAHSILHKELVDRGWAGDVFGFVQQSVGEGFIAFMAQPAPGRDPVQLMQKLATSLETGSTSCKDHDLAHFQKENHSGWSTLLQDSRSLTIQLGEYEVLGDWRMIASEQQTGLKLQMRDLNEAARWITAHTRTAGVLDPRPLVPLPAGLQSSLPPKPVGSRLFRQP
ncbi:MAG TPA: pitrilysin family protein [Oligoflexus sp.]|uniref:M16 family metallopeptidase n=1 Tax=Oligoflexus sp. TaxID=1971216 RepID=UPI002D305303|nr:pitrilysin family protein [Oligoflexus sp.]HYX34472.1 pitrilysin family protein [Oligoflexus sp.]